MANIPNAQVDQMNAQMVTQPWYRQFLQSIGMLDRPINLNKQQQQQLQQLMVQNGVQVPDGTYVDSSGNINKDERLGKNLIKGAAIAGLGATGLGLAGVGPLSGALGGILGGGGIPTIAGTSLTSGMAGAAPTVAGVGGLAAGASSAIPTIAGTALTSGMAGAAPSLAGSGGGGIMSQFSRFVPKAQDAADVGSMFQAFGNDEASNRMAEGNFSQNYDRNMLAAQQDRRTNESDALKKLAQAGYIIEGGANTKPTSIQLGGQQRELPNYGFGPTPVTEAEKQGASTLRDQMLKRLQPEGSYTPQPLDEYAKPGTGEKVGKYGSLISSGLGAARNIFGF